MGHVGVSADGDRIHYVRPSAHSGHCPVMTRGCCLELHDGGGSGDLRRLASMVPIPILAISSGCRWIMVAQNVARSLVRGRAFVLCSGHSSRSVVELTVRRASDPQTTCGRIRDHA